MPRIFRSWWLILPIFSTVVTVARFTATQEPEQISSYQRATAAFHGTPPGGPIDEWCSSSCGGGRVPIVLGFRRGRYVDVTSHYRLWLQRKLAQAKERFLSDLAEAKDAGLTGDRSQGMVQYYAVAALLNGPATARRMVLRILPAPYHSVFLKNCGLIEKVLADRRKRYAYPPAYSRAQAFADDALPPPATDGATQPAGEASLASRRSPRP